MFKNVVALVTGAANGLGYATAKRLRCGEATVIACDIRVDPEEGSLEEKSGYEFFQADVRSEEDITHVIDHIKEKHGRLDVVVNCASMAGAFRVVRQEDGAPGNFVETSRAFDVNVVGTFNVDRLSAQLMSENKPDSDGCRGILINTSGFLATQGRTANCATAGSYGAIDSMTLPMSRDLKCLGIRVVTLSPGLFLTPLTSSFDTKTAQYFHGLSVFPHRFGYASEYCDLVTEVIQNKMINGEVIKIDACLHLPIYL